MAREDALFRRLRQGDSAALDALIRAYYPEIFRYCLWHTPDRETAEDATQETFFKAVRRLDRYTHHGESETIDRSWNMELELRHVSKRYGSKTAVEDVSLTLTPGVWGLIGANGAGKTTLMRILTGILTPSEGRVLYDGIDTASLGEAYRDILGYLPQSFGFYPEFSVLDYLEYIATLKGLPRHVYRRKIDALLEQLTLTEVRKKQIKKLSGGMQRRVGIAQALLNDPDILILDEPTSGLDPGERVRFRNLLSAFARDRIVLISTHIVSDVEYIAVRNIMMKDGRIVDVGETERLLETIAGKVFSATIPSASLPVFEDAVRVVSVKGGAGGKVTVRYLSDQPELPDAQSAEPRLEDLYLWLFRQEGREPYAEG